MSLIQCVCACVCVRYRVVGLFLPVTSACPSVRSRFKSQAHTMPSRPPEYLATRRCQFSTPSLHPHCDGNPQARGEGRGEQLGAYKMALSRSTAKPLTPSLWPPGDELGSSSTARTRQHALATRASYPTSGPGPLQGDTAPATCGAWDDIALRQ